MKNNKEKQPLISVILPVYNSGLYLREAMLSVINQTYQNWEMIIVDDGSSDDSKKVVESLSAVDKRIKLFSIKSHQGVAVAANLAIKKAKGQYLARMDADDVALPNRFAKQLDFLQKNLLVVAVGSQCFLIDSKGKRIGEKCFPLESEQIYEELMSHLPIQQPSMMVNIKLLPKKFIWYHKNIASGEEHQLLFRFFQYGQVVNLQETLLKYRLHGKNTSLQHPKRDFYHIFWARLMAIFNWGYKPSLKGTFLTLSQLIVVTILPNKYIFPLFYWLQNLMKKINSWRTNFPVAIDSFKSNI